MSRNGADLIKTIRDNYRGIWVSAALEEFNLPMITLFYFSNKYMYNHKIEQTVP